MSEVLEEAYLYTVNPHKIIKGLSGVNCIRSSKSLYLTKEDVKVCLKSASVYRRFANINKNVRVTIANLDRLHNKEFIEESDYAGFLKAEKSKDHGSVQVYTKPEAKDTVATEKVTELITEPIKEEESKVTAPVQNVDNNGTLNTVVQDEEKSTVDAVTTDNAVDNADSEVKVDTPVEDSTESATKVGEQTKDQQNNQNQYYSNSGKKHKNKYYANNK